MVGANTVMKMEDKKPNTIAVFKDGELWSRFDVYMSKEQFSIGLSSLLGKFIVDDGATELRFEKYHDERVQESSD